MRNIPATLSVLLLAFTLFSCQKELSFEKDPGNNNPASLLGTWKFLGLNASVEATSTFYLGNVPGKEVVTYSTTTQNNRGFLTVTSNTMKTIDLGYTVTADVKLIKYAGGQIVNEQHEQLDFDFPPGSARSDYQQVGSDSLYFPNGSIFDIPDTNGQQLPGASDPAGARFTITGDTLVIKSAVNRATVTRQGNKDYEVTQKVNGTATFLRQ